MIAKVFKGELSTDGSKKNGAAVHKDREVKKVNTEVHDLKKALDHSHDPKKKAKALKQAMRILKTDEKKDGEVTKKTDTTEWVCVRVIKASEAGTIDQVTNVRI